MELSGAEAAPPDTSKKGFLKYFQYTFYFVSSIVGLVYTITLIVQTKNQIREQNKKEAEKGSVVGPGAAPLVCVPGGSATRAGRVRIKNGCFPGMYVSIVDFRSRVAVLAKTPTVFEFRNGVFYADKVNILTLSLDESRSVVLRAATTRAMDVWHLRDGAIFNSIGSKWTVRNSRVTYIRTDVADRVADAWDFEYV